MKVDGAVVDALIRLDRRPTSLLTSDTRLGARVVPCVRDLRRPVDVDARRHHGFRDVRLDDGARAAPGPSEVLDGRRPPFATFSRSSWARFRYISALVSTFGGAPNTEAPARPMASAVFRFLVSPSIHGALGPHQPEQGVLVCGRYLLAVRGVARRVRLRRRL